MVQTSPSPICMVQTSPSPIYRLWFQVLRELGLIGITREKAPELALIQAYSQP